MLKHEMSDFACI